MNIDLNGVDTTIGSLAGGGADIVTNSGAAAATLTAGGDNTSTTFAGLIQNGAGSTGLRKVGSGTLTLSGANSYSGGTTIAGGAINAAHADAQDLVIDVFGSGAITLNGGGVRSAQSGALFNDVFISGSNNGISTAANTTLALGGNSTFGNRGTFRTNANSVVQFGSSSDIGTIEFGWQSTISVDLTTSVIVAGGTLRGVQGRLTDLTAAALFTRVDQGATLDFNDSLAPMAIANLSGAGNVITGGTPSASPGNDLLLGVSAGLSNVFSGVISGARGIYFGNTSGGGGTMSLSGNNTYAGATTVQNGTLLVNGTIASTAAVTVESDATFGGTGTVGGPVTVNGILSAGGVAAGALTGTLTAGALAFNTGSVLREDITDLATADRVRTSGSVTLSGATLDLRAAGAFTSAAGQSITLIDATGAGTVTGRFTNFTINGGGGGAIGLDNTFLAFGRFYRINYAGTAAGSTAGNDVILTDNVAPPPGGSSISTIPTPGPDLLTASAAGDTIAALAGDDTIRGGDGHDFLFGNQDNDLIDTGAGNNTVYGGRGDDFITGGGGNDLLFGNEGADTIRASDGDNTIVGGQDSTDAADLITAGAGTDIIFGNGGDDSISAGGGNDSVIGGFGNDILFGNQGNDIILGNEGADLIFGGLGDDTLVGGKGDDTLYGNEGDDVLYGNEGADRFVFGTGSGSDLVNGFSSNEGDRLDLMGQTYLLSQDAQGSAVLTLSGGGAITLSGVAASQLGAGFFA